METIAATRRMMGLFYQWTIAGFRLFDIWVIYAPPFGNGRLRSAWRTLHTLGYLSLSVFFTWLIYHSVRNEVTPRTDAYLLAAISVSSFICVSVMVIWTWRWKLVALGLLCFFLATYLLYLRASSVGLGYAMAKSQTSLELVRALYFNAVTLLMMGLVPWAWRHRRDALPWLRRPMNEEPRNPNVEDLV